MFALRCDCTALSKLTLHSLLFIDLVCKETVDFFVYQVYCLRVQISIIFVFSLGIRFVDETVHDAAVLEFFFLGKLNSQCCILNIIFIMLLLRSSLIDLPPIARI